MHDVGGAVHQSCVEKDGNMPTYFLFVASLFEISVMRGNLFSVC